MTANLDQILNGPELSRTAAYRAIVSSLDSPALIACSGGVDSSALVILVAAAWRKGRIGPCAVVHVDHQSRPDSALDAIRVGELCRACQLPFIPAAIEPLESVSGRSTEDVWRERRYEVLARISRRLGVRNVVTAHTLDDQVETILMRLLSGSTRLVMHESTDMTVTEARIRVVRPLLDVPRAEMLRVLSIAGIEPILDPSNADTSFRRNAVRHEIVPAIASVFPGYERALLRSVTLREQDADYLNEAAASAFQELAVRERNGSLHLPRNLCKRVHLAVALRVLRLAAQDLIQEPDDRELTFERIHALYGALEGRTGSIIQLPYGIRVSVESQALLFFRAEEGNEDG